MNVTPVIAPVINVAAMPLELRRELDTLGSDLSNAFSLERVIDDSIGEILHFGFLIEGLSANQILDLVRPTALRFVIVKYYPPTAELPVAKHDIILFGSADEFERTNINSEITKFIKHYRK